MRSFLLFVLLFLISFSCLVVGRSPSPRSTVSVSVNVESNDQLQQYDSSNENAELNDALSLPSLFGRSKPKSAPAPRPANNARNAAIPPISSVPLRCRLLLATTLAANVEIDNGPSLLRRITSFTPLQSRSPSSSPSPTPSPPRHSFPQWQTAYWQKEPSVHVGGPNNINTVLIGEIPEGILISFRGTKRPQWTDPVSSTMDWIQDFRIQPISIPGLNDPQIQIHKGFWDALVTVWPQIRNELMKYNGKTIFMSGHSKGAAMALLAAARFSWLSNDANLLKQRSLSIGGIYMYGSPRVGNSAFASKLSSSYPNMIHRYEAEKDIVTSFPPGQLEVDALRLRHPTKLALIERQFNVANKFQYSPVGQLTYLYANGTQLLNSYGNNVSPLRHSVDLLSDGLSTNFIRGMQYHSPWCAGVHASKGVYMNAMCPARSLCPQRN